MAAYKTGGDVHKSVKEKSMHHMHGEAARRKRGGRADGGKAMTTEKEGGAGKYGGGMSLDREPEDDVKRSYTMPGDKPVYDAAHGEEGKGGGPGDKEIRKRGGKVKRKAGGEVKHEMPKKKHVGNVEGEDRKHRMDRPGRKRGGGVGADMAPLTTAANTTDRRGPSREDNDRGITGEEI